MNCRNPHRFPLCIGILFSLALVIPALVSAETLQAKLDRLSTRPLDEVPASEWVELIREGIGQGELIRIGGLVENALRLQHDTSLDLYLWSARLARRQGQMRQASLRYKRYLDQAEVDATSRAAAAELFEVLVDHLEDVDDAYASIQHYPAFSGRHAAGARHNLWLAEEAVKRNELAVYADGLRQVLLHRMPEAQLQYLLWSHFHQLSDRLLRHHEQGRQVVPELDLLIRALPDPRWKSRLQVLRDYLVYRDLAMDRDRNGEETPALTTARSQLYRSLAAAQEVENSAEALVETLGYLFRIPVTFDVDPWRQAPEAAALREYFPEAFGRLPEEGKKRFVELLSSQHTTFLAYIANPEAWTQLILSHPTAFTHAPVLERINFQIPQERDSLRALARVTARTPHQRAAAVGALASSSDPLKAAEALVDREGWRLSGSNVLSALASHLHDHFRSHPDWSTDLIHQTRYAVSRKTFEESAWARFRSSDVRTFLASAWAIADDPAKTPVREALQTIGWVPWSDADRAEIYAVLADQIEAWEKLLREAEAAEEAFASREEEDPAELPAVAAAWPEASRESARETIALYERLRDGELLEPGDPLRVTLQAFGSAALEGDQAGFDRNGKSLVEAVLQSDANHLLSHSALWHWLTDDLEGPDPFAVRFALLRQLLALDPDHAWATADAQRAALEAIGRTEEWVMRSGDFTPPADRKENALKVIGLIKETLDRQLDGNRLNPYLLTVLENLTVGQDWNVRGEWVPPVMRRVIESGILRQSGFNPGHDQTITTWEMLRVFSHYRNELAETFPVTDWFDERMAEDIRSAPRLELKHYDRYYRYGGQDREGKVAEAFLQHLNAWERYPLDERGLTRGLSGSAFHTLHHRVILTDIGDIPAWLERMRTWRGTTRFDANAAGLAALNWPSVVSGRAIDDREPFFADLRHYIDWAEKAPQRFPAPRLNALATMVTGDTPLTRAELRILNRLYHAIEPNQFEHRHGHDILLAELLKDHVLQGNWESWTALIPVAWEISKRSSSLRLALRDMAHQAVADGYLQQAAILSTAAFHLFSPDLPTDLESDMARIRSEALIGVGALVPVPPDHPDFGAFSAQAAYLSGVLEQSWSLFERHRSRIWETAQNLDPSFLVWIVEEQLRRDDIGSATAAIRLLVPLFNDSRDEIAPEAQARLALAAAEVPIRQREYAQARAQLRRLLTEPDWEGTRARDNALLRLTDVEKKSRNWEEARVDLERHTREGSDYLRTEAYFRLALLLVETEEYTEAARALRRVFFREPHHPRARILEGRLNLLTGRFIEATEIPIGFAEAQRSIIPGRPLRIRLEDDNLSVVGASRSIEVRVWTDDGDEEIVRLLPIGDSRTRFDVQVPTRLGSPAPGDGTLQLLGNTRIFYDFTDPFKERNNVRSEPSEVTVASDAQLLVSSGEILSDEDLELQLVERQLRAESGSPTAAAALSLERPSHQVRPGGVINLRVEDPVKSVTASPDTVRVRVASPVGEPMVLTLEETGPTTGIFERALETDRAPPRAFASDSQPGFAPAAILDPDPASVWLGTMDNRRPKFIGIDLQEVVPVETFSMEASQSGRKVTAWRLEAYRQGLGYHPIASWPHELEPWDGATRLLLGGHASNRLNLSSRRDILNYFESGWLVEDEVVLPFPFQLSDSVLPLVNENRGELNIPSSTHMVAGLVQGGLYIPATGTVTIRLRVNGSPEHVHFHLDGETVPRIQPRGREFQETRTYTQGAIPMEISFLSRRTRNITFELEWDLGQTGEFTRIPEEYLDPGTYPAIRELMAVEPANVTVSKEQTRFEVAVATPLHTRSFRFVLLDFEGDSPAVNHLALTDPDGDPLLSLARADASTTDRSVLFIAPGDTITVSYENDRNPSGRTRHLERELTATYHNATISAVFSRYVQNYRDEEEELLIPARRYLPGDGLNIVIQDPDADSSPAREEIPFEVVTEAGERLEGVAKETGSHTGSFMARIFPVLAGDDSRPGAIQVQPGEAIILRYRDTWNTDPGVPVTRETVVEQAVFSKPQLRIFEAQSEAFEGEVAPSDPDHPAGEYFPRIRDLTLRRTAEEQTNRELAVNLDAPLWVEVLFPFAARAMDNAVELFLQTESARLAHLEAGQADTFDTTVPGTIQLRAYPSSRPSIRSVPFYRRLRIEDPLANIDPLDAGRFTFELPVVPGEVPSESLVGSEIDPDSAENLLHLPGGDSIRVGVRYLDEKGGEQWVTMLLQPDSDAFMDVMDRHYRERLSSARVGDRVYLRLIHRKVSNPSPENPIAVTVHRENGEAYRLELQEVVPHSGIFRLPVQLVFADEWSRTAQNGLGTELPVRHGEKLRFVYALPGGEEVLAEHLLQIPMGVDVRMGAFSKQFSDGIRATDTLFTIAESHYELARRHREMDNLGAARRHIEQGRRLLDEGMRDFSETRNRDQAEYLLANLALELATLAENNDLQQAYFQEALSRLNELVAMHPNSSYAPMAQFRKGILYERMGEMDRASEEFVRLSYRYPDSPLVGETIVRLGRYFLTQAQEHQRQAGLEKDTARAELLRRRSVEEYTTAAEVFSRLSIRFPEHSLALRADVLSGQAYLRAEKDDEALKQFDRVVSQHGSDPRVRAEALYWLADIHARQRRFTEAYRTFTEITWDYPESEWARFARGRLTESAISQAGQRLQ